MWRPLLYYTLINVLWRNYAISIANKHQYVKHVEKLNIPKSDGPDTTRETNERTILYKFYEHGKARKKIPDNNEPIIDMGDTRNAIAERSHSDHAYLRNIERLQRMKTHEEGDSPIVDIHSPYDDVVASRGFADKGVLVADDLPKLPVGKIIHDNKVKGDKKIDTISKKLRMYEAKDALKLAWENSKNRDYILENKIKNPLYWYYLKTYIGNKDADDKHKTKKGVQDIVIDKDNAVFNYYSSQHTKTNDETVLQANLRMFHHKKPNEDNLSDYNFLVDKYTQLHKGPIIKSKKPPEKVNAIKIPPANETMNLTAWIENQGNRSVNLTFQKEDNNRSSREPYKFKERSKAKGSQKKEVNPSTNKGVRADEGTTGAPRNTSAARKPFLASKTKSKRYKNKPTESVLLSKTTEETLEPSTTTEVVMTTNDSFTEVSVETTESSTETTTKAIRKAKRTKKRTMKKSKKPVRSSTENYDDRVEVTDENITVVISDEAVSEKDEPVKFNSASDETMVSHYGDGTTAAVITETEDENNGAEEISEEKPSKEKSIRDKFSKEQPAGKQSQKKPDTKNRKKSAPKYENTSPKQTKLEEIPYQLPTESKMSLEKLNSQAEIESKGSIKLYDYKGDTYVDANESLH